MPRSVSEYYDPETDLFENWHRYYDANTGRYLEPDPAWRSPSVIAEEAGAGRFVPVYAYANNNPIAGSDPTGELSDKTLAADTDAISDYCGSDGTCTTMMNTTLAVVDAVDKLLQISDDEKANGPSAGPELVKLGISIAAPELAEDLATASTANSVATKAYDVGPADQLAANSAKGDGLDIHHAPQAHAAEQVVPGYQRSNGPAIALPHDEHVQIPNDRGPVSGSPRDLMAKAARDLRNNTGAPNSAIQRLIRLVKDTFTSMQK